ncbi:MAG: polysaccharide biosynthesis C-terminal domain-containing protein, partial [Shewanella sp.]
LSLLVSLFCNYLLIPKYGASGAASSTAIAFWVFLVLRTEFTIRVWKPLPRVALYSFTLLSIIGAVLGVLEQERLGVYIYIYWLFLLLASIFCFRHEFTIISRGLLQYFKIRSGR